LIKVKTIATQYFELGCWLGALLYLALIDPAASDHFQLCVFKWLGFSFCPGCGLGHAVSWLLHGNIRQSLEEHPLGIFALLILIHRICILLKNNFNLKKHPAHVQ
jgi:hypothetical protein